MPIDDLDDDAFFRKLEKAIDEHLRQDEQRSHQRLLQLCEESDKARQRQRERSARRKRTRRNP